MKLLITSTGNTLDAELDQRFGRCQYFIVYDTEKKDFSAVANPGLNASGGAGTLASQFAADQDVEVLITGNVGPNAIEGLNAAEIKVATNASGTVQEVIDKYLAGEYSITNQATVQSHHGTGN